jgi:hypothetical protein
MSSIATRPFDKLRSLGIVLSTYRGLTRALVSLLKSGREAPNLVTSSY